MVVCSMAVCVYACIYMYIKYMVYREVCKSPPLVSTKDDSPFACLLHLPLVLFLFLDCVVVRMVGEVIHLRLQATDTDGPPGEWSKIYDPLAGDGSSVRSTLAPSLCS